MHKQKIKTRSDLSKIVRSLQDKGKRVGYTSGVFDLLHPGHVAYLEAARALCDVLIVGVNSDASVSENKGPDRPLCPAEDRVRVIAGLASVDYVFVFDESNNRVNVQQLRPNIYIKAGDYDRSKLSSAADVESYGGSVALVDFEKGFSSTGIIQKVGVLSHKLRVVAESDRYRSKGRCVFIDRDGVINKEIEYLHDPEKLELYPDVLSGLKRLSDAGFRIAVVTNQAGIGLGYFTKEEFFRVMKPVLRAIGGAGAVVDRVYYCPHSIPENCSCRKPKPGMLLRGAEELNLDLTKSF